MVYTSALPLGPVVDSSHLGSHASLAAPLCPRVAVSVLLRSWSGLGDKEQMGVTSSGQGECGLGVKTGPRDPEGQTLEQVFRSIRRLSGWFSVLFRPGDRLTITDGNQINKTLLNKWKGKSSIVFLKIKIIDIYSNCAL